MIHNHQYSLRLGLYETMAFYLAGTFTFDWEFFERDRERTNKI